jgi:hypothetical protein
MNEGASSSVSDVDCYVIIRKLLALFSTFFRYSYVGGKFRHKKLSLSLIKHYAMKGYGGVDV